MTTAHPPYPQYPYPQYAPARPRFVEPNRSTRLAWGPYELRYALGLAALIVGTGLIGLSLHQAFVIAPLGTGFWFRALQFMAIVIVAAGWVALPAPWSRRGVAIAITCGPEFVLFILGLENVTGWLGLENVTGWMVRVLGTLAVPFLVLAWFVVRQRRLGSMAFLLLTIPGIIDNLVTNGQGWIQAGRGFRVFPEDYGWGSASVGLLVYWSFEGALLGGLALGAVWAARGVASMSKTAVPVTGPATTAGATPVAGVATKPDPAHDARVEQIRAWEAAWRDAHGGQEPPPEVIAGLMAAPPTPPTAPAPPPAPWQPPPASPYATGMYPPGSYMPYPAYLAGPPARTDGMAIASLILGIAGVMGCFVVIPSILAIIFGHVSLGRIKRTGARGRGMALAGLILGYIFIAFGAVYIVVVVVIANSSNYYGY